MQSKGTGRGILPRFGGGWMHQFGHIYALQYEMLDPNANNWFRAMELWHSAREEGVAVNVAHYSKMLSCCVPVMQWRQAMTIIHQMQREAIRPDTECVGSVLAACASSGKCDEAERVFHYYRDTVKLAFDSRCYHAMQVAYRSAGECEKALHIAKEQEKEGIPLQRVNYAEMLEACCDAENHSEAMTVLRSMARHKGASAHSMFPPLEMVPVKTRERLGVCCGINMSSDSLPSSDEIRPSLGECVTSISD